MSEFELSLQKSNIQPQNAAVQTTNGRYSQEVQGMVFCAKQYPRDQFESYQRIKQSCQRKSLAMIASYEYPRGGKKVTGASIRLAEVIAQNWGNFSCGVTELEQRLGESTCMAYAWDLETNVRFEKIFTVKHERKSGKIIQKLDDPRDIYELVANMGARRERACILAAIPKDVVDAAMEECDRTLSGENTEPIIDRIKKMFDKFKDYGVTREMIEKKIGVKLNSFTEKDVLSLGKIHNSLRDGMSKREDFFDTDKPSGTESGIDAEFKADQDRKASLALDAKIVAMEEADDKAAGKEGE